MGMPEAQRIDGDITRELAQTLHAGDQVLYSGIIYTARDAEHKRLVEALDAGEEPPISIDGAHHLLRRSCTRQAWLPHRPCWPDFKLPHGSVCPTPA